MKKTVLYEYVLKWDSGFAPSIDNQLLTLACCKGSIKGGMRNKASEDFNAGNDVWILGVCGIVLAGKNKERIYKPIYLAKISEVMEMKEYFSSSKYKTRQDHHAYKIINDELTATEKNPHTLYDQAKDIGGKYVLLSDRFVYWGDTCGESELGSELEKEFPAIFDKTGIEGMKTGVAKHPRIHFVDRNFQQFSEYIENCDWFPKDHTCLILSDNGISGKIHQPDDDEDSEEVVTCFSCK